MGDAFDMRTSNAFNSLNQATLNDRFIAAVKAGDYARAQGLIREGANINVRDEEGETMLLWTARRGQTGIALMLVARGAVLDAQDLNGDTALILATEKGNIDIARALIDAGADIMTENRQGRKAFDVALKRGNTDKAGEQMVALFERPLKDILARIPAADMAKNLSQAGVDLNQRNNLGDTALIWAVREGQEKIARAFIEAGADMRARDAAGRTPHEIARASGHTTIMEFLAQAEHENRPAAARPAAPARELRPLFPAPAGK